ncbi:MAG: hypothetical protein KGH72_00135 [Candidatus Micrarchaeota archaeon]|nr:hypothetical protein [Candidatus Micrarchaeota archaeon]
MRGRDQIVRCSNCGRNVPRNKAVSDERPIRFGTDLREADVKYFSTRKVYYCISCAKHKGIFKRKMEQAQRAASRGEM